MLLRTYWWVCGMFLGYIAELYPYIFDKDWKILALSFTWESLKKSAGNFWLEIFILRFRGDVLTESSCNSYTLDSGVLLSIFIILFIW